MGHCGLSGFSQRARRFGFRPPRRAPRRARSLGTHFAGGAPRAAAGAPAGRKKGDPEGGEEAKEAHDGKGKRREEGAWRKYDLAKLMAAIILAGATSCMRSMTLAGLEPAIFGSED